MSTIRTFATTVAALIAFPAAVLAQEAPAAAPTAPTAPPPAEPAPAPAPPVAAPPVAAPPVAAPPVADDEDPTLERQLAQAETKAAAQIVPVPPSDRGGLTVEVSLGLAALDVTIDGEDGDDDAGSVVGGRSLAVGIGGYVAPRFAMGGRVVVASATARDSFSGRESSLTTVLIGPSLQLWAHDRVFLGATVGVATVLDDLPESAADRGPGVEARVGIVAPLTRGHGLVVAASVNPTLLDQWSITSYGVQVGWQGF